MPGAGTPPEDPKGFGAPIFRQHGSNNIRLPTDPRPVSIGPEGDRFRTTMGPGSRPLTLGEALQQQQRERENAARASWMAERERKQRTEQKYTSSPSTYYLSEKLPKEKPPKNSDVLQEVPKIHASQSLPPPPLGLSATAPTRPTLSLEFKSLEFYESGKGLPPKEQRQYRTNFSKSSARYINFEINLHNHNRQRGQVYKVVWRYFKSDGILQCEDQDDFIVNSSWAWCWFSRGYGWADPGHWKPGIYRVVILIDEVAFPEEFFKIK